MINSSKIPEEKEVSAATDSKDENTPNNTPSNGAIQNDSSYRYENDKVFYQDPSTGAEFEWKAERNEWVPRTDFGFPDGPNDSSKDYEFDGENYIYRDEKHGVIYKWEDERKEWVLKSSEKQQASDSDEEEMEEGTPKSEIRRQDMSKGVYGFDGQAHTYTDSKDGTVYFWDQEKNAWFPKVDDDFLAKYQLNYGFVDSQPTSDSSEKLSEQKSAQPKVETAPTKQDIAEEQLKKEGNPATKRKQDPTWFEVDDKSNTKVYVSNLPEDLKEEEFVDLMQKCGLVMKDLVSGKMKIKMYTDPATNLFKGDALCTYIKVESVELALTILDGYEFKGKKIKVERAKFTMKGDAYDPKLKPKKKKRKEIEKLKKMQQKLFDWRPDKLRGERSRSDRVVIIKNLFAPTDFEKDVQLLLEYQDDLRQECAKCGRVAKITIFDRHPEGVAQVTFKEAEAADACIQLLNNRWFGKRQISAETWDGHTKYHIIETEEEKKERMKKWEKYLEEADNKVAQEAKKDSDQDTRSSAGSQDETEDEDDEMKGPTDA